MKSIRKKIIFPLSFLLLFSLVIPFTHAGDETAEMSILPEKNVVYTGDVFNISICINSTDSLREALAGITFNPSLLEVENVTNGGLFDIWMNDWVNFTEINNTEGTVKNMMGLSPTNPRPVSGIFAKIEFKVKNASGISQISFIEDRNYTSVINESNSTYVPLLHSASIIVNPVAISVDISKSLVGNETFFANITIDPHGQAFQGASCSLTFDSSIIHAINYTYGNLFSFTTGIDIASANLAGEITPIAGVNLSGISTPCRVISIEFKPVGTGFSYLNLTNIEIKDMSNNDMAFFATNSYVEADTMPPSVSLEFGAPYYNGSNWISSSTPIYINASDEHDYTIYYRVWNGSWQDLQTGSINTNLILHISDEGKHYIEYYAKDSLNNTSPTYNETVYVDNTPPQSTIAIGNPNYNNYYINSTTPIYINATDGDAGIKTIHYKIDNGTEISNPNASVALTLSGGGQHIIEYWAVDNLENEAQHQTATLYVDDTPPATEATPKGDAGSHGWYVSNIILNLSSSDANGCGVNATYYSFDNISYTQYTGDITLRQEGEHVLYYYAEDWLGNKEEIKEFPYKIDKAPPSITITSGPSGTINVNTATFSWTGSDNIGPISYYYTMDEGQIGPTHETTKTFSGLSDGSHIFTVKAVDDAGNSNTATRTFNVVTNKPPVANFSYSPLHPYDTQTITFADESTDVDGNVVNWTWNFGDGATSYEQNPSHKYADNGTYVVKLTVKDNDGASAAKQEIIEVLNAKPVATINYQPNKPKINEEIVFKSISSDADGTIVNWTWQFGDGSIGYGSNVNHSYDKEGSYNVTLTVTDNDGATDSTVVHVVIKKEIQNIWLPLTIIIILVIIAVALVAIWKKRTKS